MKIIVEEADVRMGRIVETWQGSFWMIVKTDGSSMSDTWALMHLGNGLIFTEFMSRAKIIDLMNNHDNGEGIKDIHSANVATVFKNAVSIRED